MLLLCNILKKKIKKKGWWCSKIRDVVRGKDQSCWAVKISLDERAQSKGGCSPNSKRYGFDKAAGLVPGALSAVEDPVKA